jgi:hypothetical protein
VIKPAPPEVVIPAAGPHHHQPLSRLLADLLAQFPPGSQPTLNQLLFRSEGRGIYLFMIVLCLPFLQPIPLFGLSTPLGLMITVLALRHAIGLSPRLPRRLGDRPLPERFKDAVLAGSTRVLKRMEKWVKPRRDRWLASSPSRWVHCSLIAILAFLLALPLPPFVIFSNVVPGFALVLVCISMMEEDGALIWMAYLAIVGNIVYFGALVASAHVILQHWKEWLEVVKSWL